jgi:RNA polymerase sigma factor (sigma-70 family)
MNVSGRPSRSEILIQGQACAERYAQTYARWYRQLGIDFGDFVSVAYVKILEHEPAWNHKLGVPFSAYVYPYVISSFRNLVRRRRRELKVRSLFMDAVSTPFTVACLGRKDEDEPANEVVQAPVPMRELAARAVLHAGAEMASLSARLWYGTEDHLAELDHQTRVARLIARALPRLPPRLRRLWHWHYVHGRTLMTFARLEGVSRSMASKLRAQLVLRIKRALQATRLLAPLAVAS